MTRCPLNKVVITGASSGIGAALARNLSRRGAILGLIARRRDALREVAATCTGIVEPYSCDVRDAAGLAHAAADFAARHGQPDAVIANAGVSVGTLTEHAEDASVFQSVMDVNVMGMVNTFQPFVTPMRASRRGMLVGIASVAGYRGLPGAGAYSASKAAAIAYLESLRVELRPHGVKVVTLCPGYVDTTMTERNPYPMPFMLPVDVAANQMIGLMERGRTYAVIPWQMALVARALHVMPRWLYDRLLAGAPHKPRRS